MRLHSHNLTLTRDLSRANDIVSPHGHNETHIRMVRNGCIGFQEDAAEAYVIADGPKLRTRVSEI
jgi:hypothetical protein